MIGYSVAPDDELMVGEYDPGDLVGQMTEQELGVLRRYVPDLLTDEGRVMVLMPLSVYAAAPATVQQILGDLIQMRGMGAVLWGKALSRLTPVDRSVVDAIMGKDNGEEWL